MRWWAESSNPNPVPGSKYTFSGLRQPASGGLAGTLPAGDGGSNADPMRAYYNVQPGLGASGGPRPSLPFVASGETDRDDVSFESVPAAGATRSLRSRKCRAAEPIVVVGVTNKLKVASA